MKTIVNKLLVLTFFSVALWGCKKDELKTTVGTSKGGQLSSSTQTVAGYTFATKDANAVTFTLTNADYGFKAASTNTLQIAKTGTSFATPTEFALTANQTTKSYTVLEFNNLLLAAGLTPDVASTVDVRVKSTISGAVSAVYSNVVVLNVTPLALAQNVYLAGSYQGWDPATADTLISPIGDGIFSGIVLFNNNSEFKLLRQKNWGSAPGQQYGAASAGFANPATLVIDPNFAPAILSPTVNSNYTKDSYLVTVNMNTLKLSYELETWGITGDATPLGWPTGNQEDRDTQMKYSQKDKKWYLTVTLVPGGFQFRRNHSWTGQVGAPGGGNITIGAGQGGTYKISLNPVTKVYTCVKQ